MKKTSKLIRLIHNPTAGDGEYSKKEIVKLIESNGYKCDYTSSKKKSIGNIKPETEFIAIAGGDGTIRKMIMTLLNKKLKYKRPIALLPFGTANNIATSLHISNNNNTNVSSWNNYHLKKFDVGQVVAPEDTFFFIEAFGYGVFPKLMKQLTKMNTDHIKTPEDEFELALKTLHKICSTYKPFKATIELDHKVFEDKYLLIEVMNIPSLGPNLKLSPDADPGDGYFDVLMVAESKRKVLSDYISVIHEGKERVFTIKSIRSKTAAIFTVCKDAHVDDQIIKETPEKVKIKNMDSLLEIVVNNKKSVAIVPSK
ncbi:diacylglycerol/lipid kinase family protein [Pedobacter panaciterrae]|jgi:Sphingosine kinase and enzymes related to eukaryotic diacylglycerol kinase|uniref:Diacylglycerol kinase family protein n=1 Tax=Pedobacter panaciterrae TaxID=363849 RepID=A0ABU8NJG9_9SPHI|nr:diacylglycerol kinase family protein [Pedobacter panaciterrae]NQX55976.1 diacylglycerol kinase [Pedobacter panaciterrae]